MRSRNAGPAGKVSWGMYGVALFVHVLGAVILFVAAGLELAGLAGLGKAGTVDRVRAHTGTVALAEPLFPAATVLLLVTGFYMLGTQWHWAAAWAWVAAVIMVCLAVVGALFNTRRFEALRAAAEAAPDGPLTGALARLAEDRTLRLSVSSMTGAAVGIVFLMTVKPAAVPAVIAILVATAVGAALASATGRPARGPAADVDVNT